VNDQTHGYGYAESGCIVTAVCTEGSSDGRPSYLPPQEMFEACNEVGLPTDKPISVTGRASIQSFVETLSEARDLLTLGHLRQVLQERCGVALETMHGQLVDSEIIEGFVIRRWRGDVEVDSIKFKIWLYQMVTQVLRPSMSGHGPGSHLASLRPLKCEGGMLLEDFCKRLEEEMGRWCVSTNASARILCRWVVLAAASCCLPAKHAQLEWTQTEGGVGFPESAPVPSGCVCRNPSRAYWITVADHAVGLLVAVMDSVEWNAEAAISNLPEGCPMLKMARKLALRWVPP